MIPIIPISGFMIKRENWSENAESKVTQTIVKIFPPILHLHSAKKSWTYGLVAMALTVLRRTPLDYSDPTRFRWKAQSVRITRENFQRKAKFCHGHR